MASIAKAVTERLKKGDERSDGERFVPLDIWWSDMFQEWYVSQLESGNRLDEAKVLWSHFVPGTNNLFAFSLWVKMWIDSEKRYKEEEFIIGRPDIYSVVAYTLDIGNTGIKNTRVVLVKEFRSSVRNKESMVYELPGGSSFSEKDPLSLAVEELKEETGLDLDPERFYAEGSRQLMATLCCSKAHLFSVELTNEEMDEVAKLEETQQTFGVEEDSEKTHVVVRTIDEIIAFDELVDWSNVGMILNCIEW